MPEHRMKQKQSPRPTSDIIMEAGRKLMSEVERSAVVDSNKHVSMLLARSRSLDVISSSSISSSSSSSSPEHCGRPNQTQPHSLSFQGRDCDQLDMYVANSATESGSGLKSNSADSSSISTADNTSVKDDSSSIVSNPTNNKKELTLLKEKSELNNNSNSENFNNSNSSRSSSISTTSSSSNYSDCSRSNNSSSKSGKSQRRSDEGAAAFQEVVLNKHEPIRITGYLEKRSKVLGWKKFWFVLDGRLLTYYKSKADYESLSACCGCINLGIASTVRPIQIRGCKGYPLQIVTRSQVYYLRSQEKPVLEQWLIAIQEASSSPPSCTLLTSWNSCSGSQYFKNPFSQSQWSLTNSTDDITDISERLGNLPDTFYEKRNRGSLAIPSPKLSQVPPVIQKYHSFQSLQTPVINNFGSDKSSIRRKLLLSSTENLRDLKPDRSPKMQHSTSLLVLDSSPQAAELRKELTRKLSINSKNSDGGGVDSNDTVPTPKFLLLSAKKKLNSVDDDAHHYAEINDYVNTSNNEGKRHYENLDADKNDGNNSHSGSARNSLRGESAERESNIYEHIETVDPMSMGSLGGPVWEPLNDGNNALNNTKRFPAHRPNPASNRNSLVSISELPEDVSISPSPVKTPALTSIPEASWRSGIEPYKHFSKVHSEDDLSSCRSESFRSLPCVEKSSKKSRKGKAIGGFLAKVFGKNKGKGNKSSSQENLQRAMIISGPVDLKRQPQMQEKPSHHEGPEYRAGRSQKKNFEKNEPEPQKSSPNFPGSRMTINNTIVMDELKQKVGHINLKRTGSRSNSGSDSDSPPKELQIVGPNQGSSNAQPRVPYIPRTLSNASNQSKPVLVFQLDDKVNETNTDDDILTPTEELKAIQETQTASICISPEAETCSEGGTIPRGENQNVSEKTKKVIETPRSVQPEIPPKTSKPWKQQPVGPTGLPDEVEADFQHKLAKFNRLSKHLSASFIAALNPPPTLPIGRSQSYKQHKSKEEIIPPLPPKKKNGAISGSTGAISLYDVPQNNRPVPKGTKPKTAVADSDHNIAEFVRNLTKKNSTPDIVLSGSNANSFPLFKDVMNDGKPLKRMFSTSSTEDNLDVHKSSPAIPPPRPPKPKPPAKPKSLECGLNRLKRNSESSTGSSTDVISEPSTITPTTTLPVQSMLQIPKDTNASPATSSKSLDIDTLDALSDAGLSDTKASNSPPDSPKVCPMHPESLEIPNDLILSCNAISPESILPPTPASDRIVPDSLANTPDAEIILEPPINFANTATVELEPSSINKLEILISDNDGSPCLKSPDVESRLDSLERNSTPKISEDKPTKDVSSVYQNIKYATVHTLIQEFETVEENEEEMSELYDDFPAEFYTPTPSSFSGYSPSTSEVSSISNDSSTVTPSSTKKHARIDSIRNGGMEQLEAYLSLGSSSTSSDECSFESCIDSFTEDSNSKLPGTPAPASLGNTASVSVKVPTPGSTFPDLPVVATQPQQYHHVTAGVGANRTGAISRLGHSSAIGHLQKILTSDVK